MHIWCICHKLALIVNAGLAALSLKTLPPGKAKELVLGLFPVLGRLTNKEEPDQLASTDSRPITHVEVDQERNNGRVADLDVDSNADYGNADNEASDMGEDSCTEPEESNPTKQDPLPNSFGGPSGKNAKSTKLKDLTKKSNKDNGEFM
ncbi:hypothetical protein PCANC_02672 [Puccinia coronata f. sp. avenae]|uniref:Uncharacterized protein n=1 Tax=Puccinia coronata f. sp. avenae TaxID=200324 RepID=A0A2N5W5G8_9BASI|nr:hypothetical protein PCANC_02672 [Puccinia coronata f. sp. avenae]